MKLSFIIVEYFSIDEINKCVESISHNVTLYDYEIIISSNSEYNPSEQIIVSKNIPSGKWIFNNKNGGFAYAMNRGLENASGDILVILNPDVIIDYGLELMIEYLLENKSIGIVGPRIISEYGVCQDSYRKFVTPINFLIRNIKRIFSVKKIPVKNIESPILVDWVIGAFMMTTKAVYEQVGGFDENYFLYCEDMDFCKKMKINRYNIAYFPSMQIIYEGSRLARTSFKYALIFMKSIIYYWSKNGFLSVNK